MVGNYFPALSSLEHSYLHHFGDVNKMVVLGSMLELVAEYGTVPREVFGLDVDLPFAAKAAVIDGKVVARGGLAWGQGRCWLWFSTEPDAPKGLGLRALRECALLLRKAVQLGETEVYTPRDADHPTSERLLKLAGFEKTDEVYDGKEIFRWRQSEQ